MASPLENLSGPGRGLAAEPPDAKEFAGLKRSGLVRLKDAENPANSLESRFHHRHRNSRRSGTSRDSTRQCHDLGDVLGGADAPQRNIPEPIGRGESERYPKDTRPRSVSRKGEKPRRPVVSEA